MPQPHRSRTGAFRLAQLALALTSGLLLSLCSLCPADPLPSEEDWAGGRIMPARAVPVDMTDEQLIAKLKPIEGMRMWASMPQDAYAFCTADVSVDYSLRADADTTVPVLFPIYCGAAALQFRLNGALVHTHLFWDLDVLRPYERAWRAVIDAHIASDAKLARISADAQREGQPKRLQDFWTKLERRARATGIKGEKRAAWDLSHYILNDSEQVWGRALGLPAEPERPERERLWLERDLAVRIDAQAPDPVALWEAPVPKPMAGGPMMFVAATLPLRAGDNAFSVRYTQPVAFVNMQRTVDSMGAGAQVCDFRFILRTARFWRSFGTLAIRVDLPEGTQYVTCSLQSARLLTQTPSPTLAYSGNGLPDQNLFVRFTAFQPTELSKRDRPPEDGEPAQMGSAPPGLVDDLLRIPPRDWPPLGKYSLYHTAWRSGVGLQPLSADDPARATGGLWSRAGALGAAAPTPRPWRRIALPAAAVLLALAATAVFARVRSRRRVAPPA